MAADVFSWWVGGWAGSAGPLGELDHSTQVKTLFLNILEADKCGDVRFMRMLVSSHR